MLNLLTRMSGLSFLRRKVRWTSFLPREAMHAWVLGRFGCGQLFATLWTVALQAPLSMGILQARILEWVAVPSSRGSSLSRDWTCVSYVSCFGRLVLYDLHHLGSLREAMGPVILGERARLWAKSGKVGGLKHFGSCFSLLDFGSKGPWFPMNVLNRVLWVSADWFLK